MRSALALLFVAAPVVAADPPEFAALKYRLVGPHAGGRVSRACGVPGDPLTYYAATASGGVWKSVDGGLSWKPVFDDQPTSSIGSIAVAPGDPNVVYVGSGEANIRGNVSPGAGLFKSDDAGRSWKHVWKQVGQIGALAVHPKNADVCFAAVLGNPFAANPERGVYRTTDGGATWQQVLAVDADTGASDVALDSHNPRVIFAGLWQARRRPWDLTSGGPGSDLRVSRDGGDTWVSLKKGQADNGLPAGPWGRVGVAVAPSRSDRVYAVIEADKGGLFRSDDGGRSWVLVNGERVVRQRAWYYSTVTVHPTQPDVLFLPQVPLLKSIDGGKTVQVVRGCHHGDHHDVWIDPTNPERMIDSNDGGVDLTLDGGKTWHAPPLPITQFYHVHADDRSPYHVMGAMQDLGTASGPSRSLRGRIHLPEWTNVGGGEAGHVVSEPGNPDVVWAGEYGGILTRFDRRTGQTLNVSAAQYNPSGIDPAKHKYRFQWTAPVVASRHDKGTVYHAGNVIVRTTNSGETWAVVSPDLTRNDKRKQGWSGGPITGDNTGAETYCTVFALAEHPTEKGLLWAGSDDGRVHLTRDNCKMWVDVTANVPDLPDWGTVECVEPSPHAADTAYLVVDNHRQGDFRPHVWRTEDFGATWQTITAGLDPGVHANVVREDPKRKGLLYLGTERGVMLSRDAGKTWQKFQHNLPTVPVHDLQVKGDDLVVATHGRSLWILDDLATVRRPAPADAVAHLWPVAPATRWQFPGAGNVGRFREPGTDNPPAGAVAWFHLKEAPGKSPVTVVVTTAAGKPVVSYTGKAKVAEAGEDDDGPPKREFEAAAGLNKFVWDLTHQGADVIPGAKVDAGNAGHGVPVVPGKYNLTLTAAGKTVTQPFEVRPDPRSKADGLAEQETLALSVRDDITRLTKTVARLRAVQKQLAMRKELLKDHPAGPADLKAAAAVGKTLTELEGKLHNPKAKVVYDIFSARGGAMLYSQLSFTLANVTSGDLRPTAAMTAEAAACRKRLDELVDEFGAVVSGPLAKLNDAAAEEGLPPVFVPLAVGPKR